MVLAAFLLGFLGSFHCIGMCGPIAIALPQHEGQKNLVYTSALLYNIGRVITYSIIGLLFGTIGKGLFIGGFQQIVSISTGAIIILFVSFPYIVPSKFKQVSVLQIPIIRKAFSNAFKMKSNFAYLVLGLINGLLPCGFVYMALSGAMLTGTTLDGSLFMMFFGIGTIPAMFTLSIMGSFVNLNFRNKLKKAIPVISILVGIILILRGMNLGIPYISPIMKQEKQSTEVDCCHKPSPIEANK
jgi:hypothetical protein